MTRPAPERCLLPLEEVIRLCAAAPAPLSPARRDILRFLLQRHDLSDETLAALRPLVLAWLVCLCPALAELDWERAAAPDDGAKLAAEARRLAGDSLSLVPLAGPLRQQAHALADACEARQREQERLRAEVERLTARLAEQEPAVTALLREERRTRNAWEAQRQAESRLRAAEDELASLRRQVEHLQRQAARAADADAAAPAVAPAADGFGFGDSRADEQGFGF